MLFPHSRFDSTNIVTAALDSLQHSHSMPQTLRTGKQGRQHSILHVGGLLRSKLGNSIYEAHKTARPILEAQLSKSHRGKPQQISFPTPPENKYHSNAPQEFLTLDLGPTPFKSLDMDIGFYDDSRSIELASFHESSSTDFSQSDSATEASANGSFFLSPSWRPHSPPASMHEIAGTDAETTSKSYSTTNGAIYLYLPGPGCQSCAESSYLWHCAD